MSKSIAIVVCTYNEEKTIKTTLTSIVNQAYFKAHRDRIQLVLADSQSQDDTQNIASQFVDEIIQCPRGKLTSRDKAYRQIEVDIIVAADGDRIYFGGWLETLIENSDKENIVATTGLVDYKPIKSLLDIFIITSGNFCYELQMSLGRSALLINGGNAAFLKETYVKTGGFELNFDETNFFKLWSEEELKFCKKLSKLGRVFYTPEAICKPLRRPGVFYYLFGEFSTESHH
jgi:glycosyltransferase involved in cell wall biosynthesis